MVTVNVEEERTTILQLNMAVVLVGKVYVFVKAILLWCDYKGKKETGSKMRNTPRTNQAG